MGKVNSRFTILPSIEKLANVFKFAFSAPYTQQHYRAACPSSPMCRDHSPPVSFFYDFSSIS